MKKQMIKFGMMLLCILVVFSLSAQKDCDNFKKRKHKGRTSIVKVSNPVDTGGGIIYPDSLVFDPTPEPFVRSNADGNASTHVTGWSKIEAGAETRVNTTEDRRGNAKKLVSDKNTPQKRGHRWRKSEKWECDNQPH